MDPFLEGSIWHAVHNGMIYQLAAMLSEAVPDDLFVDTEVKTILVDEIGTEFSQMYPDVAIYNANRDNNGGVSEPDSSYGTPFPETIIINHLPVKTQAIKVIEIESRRVVSTIEVVSPVNKFGQGFEDYEEKINELHLAGVNVLEIDLIRRGKRRYDETRREVAPYCVQLFKAATHRTGIWLIQLNNILPTIQFPLRHRDKPVLLDLQQALDTFYQDRKLWKRINYGTEAPPPAMSETEIGFTRTVLTEKPK